MEWILIVVLVFGLPLSLAIWLIARTISIQARLQEMSSRLTSLELDLIRLKGQEQRRSETRPAAASSPDIAIPAARQPTAPPQPAAAPTQSAPTPMATPAPQSSPARPATPPPLITPPPPPRAAVAAAKSAIDWEQFMGVKLFAWVGGLALFLGVAFFIKYSFERNWITPELRVMAGFLTGIGLLVGGVLLHRRKQYVVGAQTLCATGILILYATTFACRSIYHFEFFGLIPTFLLMILITATAFLLAVRLDAQVVAILGMLGGFLTPVLLSTGEDNPFGLFGYIAILDAGLLVVAMQRRWFYLTAWAALGTVLMQMGWVEQFFTRERYFEGNRILIPMGVLLLFTGLFAGAVAWLKRRGHRDWWLTAGALGVAAVALAFAAYFISFTPLAARPWLLLSFVFIVDLAILAISLLDDRLALAQPLASLAVFALLAGWTAKALSNDLLVSALAFYFVFAVAHTIGPIVLRRVSGVTPPPWWSQTIPPLALVLVLLPIFQLSEVSFLIWPFVLLVDLLAIGLAIITASLLPVVVVLLLTLAATGALIFKIPATLTGLPSSFFVLGAFAIFFVAVGVWLSRKAKFGEPSSGRLSFDNQEPAPALASQLPVASAVLPFLLLIMATLRLPMDDPSPVFGLALLLVVLLLGLTRLFSLQWLPAVGLACVAALECTWHFKRFNPADPGLPLVWYLIFFAIFAVFPFVFPRQFGEKVGPWAAAALAGPAQFFLIHRLVRAAYPNEVMGLLPAAFAIPALLSLIAVLKRSSSSARLAQLAWFGGVALFFITLIFPIQFERQWITIGWAMEGAALLWLFHRVPHDGLRLTGVALLLAAFVRLAVNPDVFEYGLRGSTPILNWYLYTYGIVTLCLFAGARLLAPPRNEVMGSNVPPILAGLGVALAFLLVNIEIADYFSAPGSRLSFRFSGNFARGMTYTVAWALFALVLLVIGIVKKWRGARYAALALLSLAILKLFFHDLAALNQLYRIGAFIGVAIIAMLASFAYQRFFASAVTPPNAEPAR